MTRCDRHRIVAVASRQHQVVTGTRCRDVRSARHRHRTASSNTQRVVFAAGLNRQVRIDRQHCARTIVSIGDLDRLGFQHASVQCGTSRQNVGTRSAERQSRPRTGCHVQILDSLVGHSRRRCVEHTARGKIHDDVDDALEFQRVTAVAALDRDRVVGSRAQHINRHRQPADPDIRTANQRHCVIIRGPDQRHRVGSSRGADVDVDPLEIGCLDSIHQHNRTRLVHRDAARVRIVQHVGSASAFDRVHAVASGPDKAVRTLFAEDRIGSLATGDRVVALPTQDQVDTRRPDQYVVTIATQDRRVDRAGSGQVDRVVPLPDIDEFRQRDRVR